MLKIAILFFALGAIMGLTILLRWLNKKEASNAVIYSHGLFGAIGLILLGYAGYTHQEHFPTISLILFILVATVGFYMFFTTTFPNRRPEPKPIFIALVHGLVAVASFVLLLYSVLG